MNTLAATPSPISSPLHQEWEMFQVLLTRLVNGILNRVFALTIRGSRWRRVVLVVLFLLVVAFLYLTAQGLTQWLKFFQVFFSALLTNQPSIKQAATLFFSLVFDARILRLVPVFFLPFLVSREFASRYLADIFKLDENIDDVKIARKFISEVSLGGADNKLTVSVDNFDLDETKKSPIRRIGGPGRVTVELGTAILVERPDGRPRIIDSTHSEEDEEEKQPSDQRKKRNCPLFDWAHFRFKPRALPRSEKKKTRKKKDKVVLEGFERIREPIDLRVQIPEALELNARSRDGIPIKAIDARVVFSITRGPKTPTLREPYPYTDDAIRAMIFNAPHRVAENSHEHWQAPTIIMKSLLRKELGEFMSSHELGVYLACIGQPETDAINTIEEDISIKKQKISGLESNDMPFDSSILSRRPRSELSRLFNDFNGKFNQEQRQRGVEAQWVGVGTWKMPPGIPEKVIPEKHLNAWQITLDNLRRGSKEVLRELALNAQAERIQQLILQTPINDFRNTPNPEVNINRVRLSLITAYWQQLNEEIENLTRKGESIPPSMVVAYFKLLLTFSHPPYPNIPAPASTREKKYYGELLKRVKIYQAIEKLIDLERRFAPNANRADLLERIIKTWDADVK